MMAENADESVLPHQAQPAQSSSLAYPAPENTTPDSSAAVSQPPASFEETSAEVPLESLLSPTQATSSHLPPRPQSNLSSSAATPNLAISDSSASAPAPAPRIRGGFEVDDDDEDTEDVEAGKDDVDVYDPAAGFDVDAPTPAHVQTPLDRSSQSPERENGTTPVPAQTSGSLDGAVSSTLAPGADSTAVLAAIPAPAPVEPQPEATPSRSDVHGSALPAVSKSRLAHDTVGILEDRIKDDPRGDTEAYLELINEFKSRNKEDEVRKIYDDYLKVFPLDVSLLPRLFI